MTPFAYTLPTRFSVIRIDTAAIHPASRPFPAQAAAAEFLDGTPTIIMENGKLYRSNMKKAKLDLSEFMVMCREQGYFSLSDIHTAVFEYNGKLTILPVSPNAPSHRRT